MNNYYRHKLQNLEKAMETARDISCSACASKYWGYIPEIKNMNVITAAILGTMI